MKFIIDKETFEKLDESLKSEYTLDGEQAALKLEGHEEHFVPTKKREIEAEHRKTAEKKLAEVEAREARLLKDLEEARGSKTDMEKVRAEYQAELEKVKANYAEKEKAARAEAHKAMIREEATKFANEKFTVPTAVTRLLQDRMMIEEVEGQAVIRILDTDGKISPLKNLKDLQEEFLTNEELAPIIKATNGKGSGANPSLYTGSSGAKTINKEQFDSLSQDERHSFFKDGGRVSEE